MVERKRNTLFTTNLLVDSILKSLAPDPKQRSKRITWDNFYNKLTQDSFTINLGGQICGLNLANNPEAIKFLRELIRARINKNENPEQWNNFLEKTTNLPEDFFNQPLGQFDDPNVRPVTLRELNASLMELLNRGVSFDFNEQ